MEFIRRETNYVGGLAARSGDPSPHTARGVFRAMQAAARQRWGSDSLAGKTVAIQGCGHVGECLARELHRAGARLIVSDVEQNRATKVAHDLHAQVVGPSEIYSSAADVFAPCALGAVLNDETIPRLPAEIVCGAANNQLLDARHGEMLRERKILYVPDYAANAGGVVNGCCRELLGWSLQQTLEKIEAIYNTIRNILDVSTQEGITPDAAADRIAESRFAPDRETTDRKKSPTAILR
jgi:leucine dehydrogenase